MNVFGLISGLLLMVGHGMTAAEYFQSRFRPAPSMTPVPNYPVDSAEYTAFPQASAGILLTKEHKALLRGFKKNHIPK
jgi:hypothetical protein